MTALIDLPAAADLRTRAEAAIQKTMDTDHLTLRAAIVKTAQAWREEAAAKGWSAQEVNGIRHFVLQVGAKLANTYVSQGIITRQQFLAS